MSMIDDIKTKITDQEYKELCDKMMELNKKQTGFYEIKYIEPLIQQELDEGGYSKYVTKISIETRIVKIKITEKEIEFATKQIQKCGIYCGQGDGTGLKNQQAIRDIIDNRRFMYVFGSNGSGDDDIKIDVEPSESIEIISIKQL